MRRLAAIACLVLLTSCTPAQLATLERLYGDMPDRRVLRLPDAPGTLHDGRTLNLDGSITAPVAPAGSRCPQHYTASLAAGWTVGDWSKLDYIMYRESRCIPTAYNGRGMDDSYGLLQNNMKAHRSWVGPLVGWDFSRLFDPVTNLRIGRTLYHKARAAYGCGWQPWRATNSAGWCN